MKRPWQVTLLGWLFIVVGLVGLFYHLSDRPLEQGVFLISIIRLLAVVGGVCLLLGQGWARWLLLAWMALHVWISALHSMSEFLPHLVLLIVIGYVLLRPPVSTYFRRASPKAADA